MANDLLFGGEPVLASPVRLVFGADIRSPTDLVFAESPVTRLPVRLVFGDDTGSSSQPDATVVLDAVLPGLSGAQAIVLGLALAVRSTLPGLICSAAVQYQSQTQRPTVATRVRHQMTQVVDLYRASFKLATTKGSTGRLGSVF